MGDTRQLDNLHHYVPAAVFAALEAEYGLDPPAKELRKIAPDALDGLASGQLAAPGSVAPPRSPVLLSHFVLPRGVLLRAPGLRPVGRTAPPRAPRESRRRCSRPRNRVRAG